MRISQLSLEGRGAWPDLHLDTLSPQLNVFFAAPRGGKSTVARLLSHLLYGKTDSPWRLQFGQSVPLAEGTISLSDQQDEFILRRHSETDRQPRLTITSTDGNEVSQQSVRDLLSGLDPKLASTLYAVDFTESPIIDSLLSETFSRQFMATQHKTTPEFSGPKAYFDTLKSGSVVDRVDRQRIDELTRRRDAIAEEIEQRLSVRRHESGVLEQELKNVELDLKEKGEQSELLRSQLHNVESQLAELEARLRYFSLETTVQQTNNDYEINETNQELEQLDLEISRCRQSLVELQTREVVVRTELARLSPDGTADSVTCLADGRTTLSVMEKLLDDLDAEISQLARANEPGRYYATDAHAKLSPVAEILRQQVYTLCGQLTEQERIASRQQARAESRQLIRSQADLGERLELLLSRRETLVQQSRQIGQQVALSPLPPVVDHCRCESHGHFVADTNAYRLGSASRPRIESDLREKRTLLERERSQLVETLTNLQHELDRLEVHWKNLQSQRSGLLGKATLEEQQAELERLETIINQSLASPAEESKTTRFGVWRASDVLAQLTDGHLVQIHLERHGRQATVVDRNGRTHEIESLSSAQHDAIYLSLTLALVGSYSRRGVNLPLILDEPFLRQDAASAAAMAGVLEEFARAGHQLLVFTEDRDAQRRFSSLGAQLFDLESIRRKRIAPTLQKTKSTTSTSTRITRKSTEGHQSPAIRIASEDTNQSGDAFYLKTTSSLNEFPVLGEDTGTLFALLGIRSVGDLLAADAEDLAQRLGRSEIRAETVRLWQTHMGLMCFVPELTLNDAQLFEACGICSPDDLYDIDVERLLGRIEKFLSSERGRRYRSARIRYNHSCMSNWIASAGRYRDRWNQARTGYSWSSSRRKSKRNGTSRRNGSTRRTSKRTIAPSELRFYLQREDPVEDAPSIGPKTADRLGKAGIRTVADLLNADPESTAEELGVKHIKADLIAAWQQQARLVCRIPLLRGFGAQLLVGCGFTEPEQISNADAEVVANRVVEFSETKKGQRILRNGTPPTREVIDEWIACASHTRPLDAA